MNKANLTVGSSNDASIEAFAKARLSEEPGARKPHVGICARRGRATALSTATVANSR
jgi:hypothetical protein